MARVLYDTSSWTVLATASLYRSWGPESDQLLERHSAQDFKDLEEGTRTTKSKGQ
jgi:hypothetical protein